MKVTMTYEGKSVEVEVKDEEFKSLFEEPKKLTGWEKADYKGSYWTINNRCRPDSAQEDGVHFDTVVYESGNYFSNRELSENMGKAISLWMRIQRRASEICDSTSYQSGTAKWHIIFKKGLVQAAYHWDMTAFGVVYFDTRTHAEQVIKEFRGELTWYFTEFKNRMDV